ncbi:hypothetical protein [Alteripontixanthobacter maritimus]|nr:hypothetical protein [Alteripontixanthobacter maritimus]
MARFNAILKTAILAGSALSLAGCAASSARTASIADAGPTKGQLELAKLTEGMVAGEPQRCISTFGNRALRIVDETALVYDSGQTVYVNMTQNPRSLDDDDILVIRKFGGTQLCRLDQVTTADRLGGFFTGAVFLTDFVPYTKPG